MKSFHPTLKHKLPFLVIVFALFNVSPSIAQESTHDWPQWMGPERNGSWQTDIQKDTLTPEDMTLVWEIEIGSGYSGPSTSKGKVYVMDLLKEEVTYERILCLDANSGEINWSHAYECDYSMGYPTGPRATVLVEDDRAYAFGAMGDLHCLDANTGKVLWKINGQSEYNIDYPIWGLAASPLIENDLLIVQMGGQPDACLVAFNKLSGIERWRALSDQASYSPPLIIEHEGERVLVCWTGDNFAGLKPGSGEVYWKIPFESKKSVINISDPVVSWPYIFLSSFYEGSMLVELSENGHAAKLLYHRKGESERKTDALHCIISTPFIQGKHVYGIDSYGEFRCLELMSGDRVWSDNTLTPYGRWSNAHFAKQGQKIWAFNEVGELVMGQVSPIGFQDMGRVKLIDPVPMSPNPRGGVNWAFPAFSGRRVYARSDAKLVCWEIK